MTIFFVFFVSVLAWFSPQKFWYVFVLILGVAVQMGYQLGMVGTIVWLGLAKVARDIFYAGTES
jgi:hypothetical protein